MIVRQSFGLFNAGFRPRAKQRRTRVRTPSFDIRSALDKAACPPKNNSRSREPSKSTETRWMRPDVKSAYITGRLSSTLSLFFLLIHNHFCHFSFDIFLDFDKTQCVIHRFQYMSYIPYILALHYPLRSFSTSRSLSHFVYHQPFAPFVGANRTRVNWHLHLNRIGSSIYTYVDINYIFSLTPSFIRFFASLLTHFFINTWIFEQGIFIPSVQRKIYLVAFHFHSFKFSDSGIEEEKRYNWQIIIVLHNERLMTGD